LFRDGFFVLNETYVHFVRTNQRGTGVPPVGSENLNWVMAGTDRRRLARERLRL